MDNKHLLTLVLLLVFLILLSAFFAGSETALMALNRYRLRHLAKSGDRGAQLAEKLLERPDRLIGMILLGNIAANSGCHGDRDVHHLRAVRQRLDRAQHRACWRSSS